MSGAANAAAGTVVRQGYLRKLKTMKRKYFVLRGETVDCSPRLEYYESEKKFRSGATPRRVIPLKSCFNIARRFDLKQRHVIALYTKEEQFCVCGESEDEVHTWLTDIWRQYQCDDTIEELLHPTQHVWHVNVQKKGLGASKNITGPYNLCLTDKTLTLVKIRRDHMLADQLMTDGVEFSLTNIRRCGDSECFFYMEVGRQTVTGAGELWMHTEDANIAQSMHNTIYNAMCNCKSEKEDMRLRSSSVSEDPRAGALTGRRSTYSIGSGRAGLTSIDKSSCVGSCIKQCVCAATNSIDESAAAMAPLAPKYAGIDNQQHNTLISIDDNRSAKENAAPARVITHHRTASLPTGYPTFQEPLRIVHERTRSAPLTGDEVDVLTIEKAARYSSSCKAVNGTDFLMSKKSGQWSRRASTGTKLSKLSPAHTKHAPIVRNRCESMPSRSCPPLDPDRTPLRTQPAGDGSESGRDEPDAALQDRHRTPRIPEEPDYCEMTPVDIMNMFIRKMGSSMVSESPGSEPPDGYLPMAPATPAADVPPALSASSGSVCSGTPSTDPRFSEYQLEPATAHILDEEDAARHPRAYSVGSRPARPAHDAARLRAYSVGARTRTRPAPPHHPAAPAPPAPGNNSSSAPLLPRASAEDLMELDFSNNSPKSRVILASTPPSGGGYMPAPRLSASRPYKPKVDEYVDMSPRAGSGYVEMSPRAGGGYVEMSPAAPAPAALTPAPVVTTPDGYVEMNYGSRTPSRPITIVADRTRLEAAPPAPPPPPPAASTPPDEPGGRRRRGAGGRHGREPLTPLGSQTIFPLSLDSPASPPGPPAPDEHDAARHDLDPHDVFDEEPPAPPPPHHPLSTVREISEECARRSPPPPPAPSTSPPHYVTLARTCSQPIAAPAHRSAAGDGDELSCNPTATKTWAGDAAGKERRSASPAPPAAPPPPPPGDTLNYAALDLEPRAPPAAAPASPAAPPRPYTQIDFARSEKLHAADGN